MVSVSERGPVSTCPNLATPTEGTQAAASSMDNGTPSAWITAARTWSMLSAVNRNRGATARTESTKSCTAGLATKASRSMPSSGTRNGASTIRHSPRHPIRVRLVTRALTRSSAARSFGRSLRNTAVC